MNETISIRPAIPEDAKQLNAFARSSFIDTYAVQNDPGVIDAYVEKAFTESQIQIEIADKANSFLIAHIGAEIVGYVKLRTSEAHVSLKHKNPLEIERFYAAAEYHGKGIAQILMAEATDYAHKAGYDSLWLGVFKSNPRAIRFYEKSSFEIVGTQVFMMADDPQEDWVMERTIEL